MSIAGNRTTGAVGASLTITGAVSTVGSVASSIFGNSGFSVFTSVFSLLAFLGFVLFMVAMHGFSKDYSERKIFSHALNGFLFGFVAVIIAAIFYLAVIMALIFNQRSSLGQSPFIGPALGSFLVVLSLIMLGYMIFNYKAFKLLGDKSGVQQFYSTSKILVLGAIINVVISSIFAVTGFLNSVGINYVTLLLAPGGFIQYIAWGYALKGFLAIKPPETPPSQYYAPSSQMRYCPNCGTQTQPNDAYCDRCGKKLQ